MSTPEDDKLDALLRCWADQHAASNQRLNELAQLVCDRLNNSPEQADRVTTRHIGYRRSLVWAAVCGAVAASITTAVYIADRVGDSSTRLVADNSDEEQRIESSFSQVSPVARPDIAEKEMVAREMQQMFPGQFAWFLETSDGVELGLRPDANTSPGRMIAIRFIVESQGREAGVWKTLRTFDIVTRSEEVVEASPSVGGVTHVSLWAYAMPDGMLSVDAELDLKGPVPIRVSSSRLTATGSSAEIWRADMGGVQYRIHQVAELIDDERIG
jgi:hypothetical protein